MADVLPQEAESSSSASAAPRPPDASLLIPIKLDVFAIGDPKAYASQCPNVTLLPTNLFDYSKLRLQKRSVQADLQDHADFESAKATNANPRLFDVTTSQPRDNVSGVYISWTLPQIYRWQVTSTKQDDFKPAQTPPNRWMVVRVTRDVKTIAGWVIESDVYRHIDTLDPQVDLMTDVSQYIREPKDLREERAVDRQGEYFLGRQLPLKNWKEDTDSNLLHVKPLMANSAGNILFADYQPHNPNVFSFRDPLNGVPAGAQVGYSVIGWHADPNEDPFMIKETGLTNKDILGQFNLNLDASRLAREDVQNWMGSTTPARHMCHGSTYSLLKWDPNPTFPSKRDPNISSDAGAAILKSSGSVAVGANPFDAFGAFINSAKSNQIHEDLRKLQQFSVTGNATDVDKETAADEFLKILGEFKSTDGGSRWKVQPSSENPTTSSSDPEMVQLSETQKAYLEEVNALQWACDHLTSNLNYRRWELFCGWWRWVTAGEDSRLADLSNKHDVLVSEIQNLVTTIQILESQMSQIQQKHLPALAKVPWDTFMQRKDPTLALLGCKAPWPEGFSGSQPVRLYSQAVIEFSSDKFGRDAFYAATRITGPIKSIPAAADTIHSEQCGYMTTSCGDPLPNLHDRAVAPPYSNAVYNTDAIIDSALVPLYVEWEAEYIHVPYDLWKPAQARGLSSQIYSELTQNIGSINDLSHMGTKFIRRSLGGRALLHPGPGHSLANLLENAVSRLPESELKDILPPDQRAKLYAKLKDVPSLSCRLDGFSDQLVTLLSGTSHLQPTLPDGSVMPEALAAAVEIGFTEETLGLVKDQCDPIPYDANIDHEAVFIPVTHGQLRFKKLNLIDKFGRGVEIVGKDGLSPCISSAFKPSARKVGGNDVPNVVEPTGDNCQFFQVPPSINQPARLFNSYLKPSAATSQTSWIPCTEWDDPVCGYIMYNSVDLSIQVFNPAGELYTEILTTEGTFDTRTAQWNPPPISQKLEGLAPVPEPDQWKVVILNNFIECLKNPEYAIRIIQVLGDAASCSGPPAESYSSVINAAFGRPFALAVAGWSIELSHEELKPQTTAKNVAGQTHSSLSDYEFPLHIGLKEHSNDGLAAYFPVSEENKMKPDFRNIYTFWPSGIDAVDRNEYFKCNGIHVSSLPTLQAHHVEPFNNLDVRSAEDMVNERFGHISPFALLVDLFHPVKAQTGVLPPSNLSLPDWPVQQALKTIRIFYRAGPFLFREDPLKGMINQPESIADGDRENADPGPEPVVPPLYIPTVPYGQWEWLQPYLSGDDIETKYWSQPVSKSDISRPVLEDPKSPYTMVDGVMRSTEPLLHSPKK
ncbi:hypothetical protein TWF481_007011 [Arthrobotrys musiformis]|uniref:Uncharacterized protein n=1 Tax=Arthrobotrys musiformis TaxID=47236 RepID=A0AAV9WB17_9PEZI